MRMLDELDQYPLEKRVSVFMRNDRESPKGQRPLPANQNSYVLRDLYPFEEETGYFINLLNYVYRELVQDKIIILNIYAINNMLGIVKLWNWIVAKLRLKWLIKYSWNCYSYRAINLIEREKAHGEYPCCIRYKRLQKEEKQKDIAYPYQKSILILHEGDENLYMEIARQYLFERERNDRYKLLGTKFNILSLPLEVDPRGPGLRIYPVYEEFSHLQGEELVEAYLDSEPMMELILARCEQEVEIRINESLISVEEVIERIRKDLEPMQWRLEVRL